jgi:hypothetical protein
MRDYGGVTMGGGWFADVIVGYFITLFKICARLLRSRNSKGWRETSATVAGATCQMSFYMPRPVAEITYTYRIDGGFYGGVDEKPFFFEYSARDYVKQLAPGDTLVIRVKPGEPGTSVARNEDQTRVKESATSTRETN